MKRYGVDPHKKDKNCYTGAGHMARAEADTEASMALRTRCPQRQGDAQTKQKSKWDGVHPKIFSCCTSEAQITAFKEYTEGTSSDTKDNTTWLQKSQIPRNTRMFFVD